MVLSGVCGWLYHGINSSCTLRGVMVVCHAVKFVIARNDVNILRLKEQMNWFKRKTNDIQKDKRKCAPNDNSSKRTLSAYFWSVSLWISEESVEESRSQNTQKYRNSQYCNGFTFCLVSLCAVHEE